MNNDNKVLNEHVAVPPDKLDIHKTADLYVAVLPSRDL